MKFPTECFPPAAKAMMDGMGEIVGSRPEYAGLGLLFLGSIVSARVKIRVKKGWHLNTNCYFAVVADKGEAKSPAIKFMISPMVDIFTQESNDYHKDYKEWKKKLDKVCRAGKSKANEEKIEAIENEEPKMPWWGLVTDGTPEGLRKATSENHENGHPLRMGRVSEELDGWISNLSRYNEGSDKAFYLQAFDGDPNIKANKGEKSSSPPLTLSLIGTIQPEIFSGCFSGDNTQNGLLDRIMIAAPMDAAPEVDPYEEWDDDVLSNYKFWAERFVHSVHPKKTFIPPCECREVGREFYDWIKRMDTLTGAGASAKWWQHFHKVAAILAVLWEKDEIDVDIFEKASKVTKYYVSCWIRSFKSMNKTDTSKAEDRIITKMKSKPQGEMKESEVKKLFPSDRRFMSEQAIKFLIEDGRLESYIVKGKNGKDTTILRLPVSEVV
jgi:hypothetical protein